MSHDDLLDLVYYRTGKFQTIVGTDEVGRGPLAGPVVAAAVVLPPGCHIEGLTDSKRLTARRRKELFPVIAATARAWAVAPVWPGVIDRINILQASLAAMRQAVEALKVVPDICMVDGNQRVPRLDLPQETVVDGDSRVHCISAASVLAKVVRDTIMEGFHQRFPYYGFDSNKGYGTPQHLAALRRYGPSPLHRRSFAPVRQGQLFADTGAGG